MQMARQLKSMEEEYDYLCEESGHDFEERREKLNIYTNYTMHKGGTNKRIQISRLTWRI